MRLLPAISVLALVVEWRGVSDAGRRAMTIHSSAAGRSAGAGPVRWMSWRIVLLAVALCLWIAPQLKGYQPAFRYFHIIHSAWQGN